MLSICIPIYNFKVTTLVKNLYQQSVVANIDFEIVCFDDGSEENFKIANREIQNLDKVSYTELPENYGRSKIRNELGKAAKFPYLIFMDCDSETIDERYIENYVVELERLNVCLLRKNNPIPDSVKQNTLLYGGRVYHPTPPKNRAYFFHWKYGRKREQKLPVIRQMNPHLSFMTNNFLIAKALFLNIQFDEDLTQYGHEDTLFGLELKERKINILHLNNPLIHIGLEPTEVFLMKTKQGIQNLHFLSKKTPLFQSKLLNYYHTFSKLGLIFIFHFFYRFFGGLFVANFHSPFPILRLFDFYKLGYLASLKNDYSAHK